MTRGEQLDLGEWAARRVEVAPAPAPAPPRRPRRRRRSVQVEITFAHVRPSRVVEGERIGQQTVIGVNGDHATIRCDCGDVRSVLWARLLDRGSTSCVRCAARGRAAARSIPSSPWWRDRVCLDVIDAHPEGASLEEIADAYGVARESVRQVEALALVKLAEALGVPESRMRELLGRVRRRRQIEGRIIGHGTTIERRRIEPLE